MSARDLEEASELVNRITQTLAYAGWAWVSHDGKLTIHRDGSTWEIVISKGNEMTSLEPRLAEQARLDDLQPRAGSQ